MSDAAKQSSDMALDDDVWTGAKPRQNRRNSAFEGRHFARVALVPFERSIKQRVSVMAECISSAGRVTRSGRRLSRVRRYRAL